MSNGYEWLKLWSEARNDAKLRSLTDAQFRVWFNLLCLASEQRERGTFDKSDLDILAVEVAGGDTALLSETLDRLYRLRILIEVTPSNALPVTGNGRVAFRAFATRNERKPSDAPERVRQRVADHRARRKAADPSFISAPDVTPVTRYGALVTRGNALEQEQIRSRSSTQAASTDRAPLSAEWRAAAADILSRSTLSPQEVADLLEMRDAGHSLEAVRWALERARQGAKSRNLVGYAKQCVADFGKQQARGSPNGTTYAVPKLESSEDWKRRKDAEYRAEQERHV